MDNDLMARRLRPPSQPNSGNSQQPADQPGEPSPWDVPLTTDGQFAPPQSTTPPNDPPFAPQFGQPDPTARADVPWDRPAPEAWPPTEQTWSASGGDPAGLGMPGGDPAMPPRSEWPAADALGESAAPWDRPDSNAAADQWRDPDDAFAPVVADVQAPAAWAARNGNGNGHSSGGGNGIYYAAPSSPERMTVAAHSDQPPVGDQPPAGDRPYSSGSNPLPDWPAEDDLTVTPPSGRGPVMPEDSWPVIPPSAQPPAPAWPPLEPPAPPAAPDWTEPAVAAAQPDPQPEPEPQVPTPPPPPTPRVEVSTPPNTQIVAVTPSGTPQNMVLRIELAIVDESHRANPAETAKRVGPDADVRRPEYEPRNAGGRASMPEPEYIWAAPPDPQNQQNQQPQHRARQGQHAQPVYRSQPPQHVAPPPSAWLPAPQQPQNLDWDLPPVAPAPPMADPPAPWSSPGASQSHQPSPQSPYAPAPTWAMTQPAPPYQPEPPQYMPPPAAQYQQAPAPQYPQAAPPYQPPPAPRYPQPHDPWQQTGYQPAAQPAWPPAQPPFNQPTRPQQMPQPMQSAPLVQSAPAAGSRARTGGVAADQADLWFLNNQPAATSAVDADVQPDGKSNSILTAGLTIGFALLVIVLVLVFIQLMTSLLR